MQPKRKRVCKKYTGLKPHGCGPDTLKRVCKRYTGLKPKVCGPPNGNFFCHFSVTFT